MLVNLVLNFRFYKEYTFKRAYYKTHWKKLHPFCIKFSLKKIISVAPITYLFLMIRFIPKLMAWSIPITLTDKIYVKLYIKVYYLTYDLYFLKRVQCERWILSLAQILHLTSSRQWILLLYILVLSRPFENAYGGPKIKNPF